MGLSWPKKVTAAADLPQISPDESHRSKWMMTGGTRIYGTPPLPVTPRSSSRRGTWRTVSSVDCPRAGESSTKLTISGTRHGRWVVGCWMLLCGRTIERTLREPISIWWFPKIGVPLNHQFIDGIFHEINHAAIGVPP